MGEKLMQSHCKKWPRSERFAGGGVLDFIAKNTLQDIQAAVKAAGYEFVLGFHYPSEEQIALAKAEQDQGRANP